MNKYYQLTAQPFSLYFQYKPYAPVPNFNTLATELGEIHVTITVNGVTFAPYGTGIRATFNAYNLRWSSARTEESQLLNEKLLQFIQSVEAAHTHLEQKKDLMDGPSMIRIAKLFGSINHS